MKTLFSHLMILLGAALISVFVSGCCTQRKAVEGVTTTEKTTDTRVETYTEYKTDTLYVDIPAQKSEILTQDSTSFLENDFATSEARINADGSLYHNLNTKPQRMPVEFQKPIERKDSITTEYIYKEVEKPVEVEKKLSFWEATSIRLFPWSAVLLILSIVIGFRKPIWSLIKNCLP